MKGVTWEVPAPKVGAASFRFGFWTVVGAWVAWKLLRALGWLLRQPVAWIVAGLVVAGLWLYGHLGVLGCGLVGAGLVAGLVSWRCAHRPSFCRFVWWPLRAWWRRWVVYGAEWALLMNNVGLARSFRGKELVPPVRRVRCTGTVEHVRVRMLAGQVLADFADNADRFASTFCALDCRVRSVRSRGLFARLTRTAGRLRPRLLDLWFLVADPLADPVPLFAIPAKPTVKALPVALREDGYTWALRILGTHVLIAGATGAGKGSVLWSIIRALCPGIASGLVELWVIDPKGGMELSSGQPLYARYCYGDVTPTEPTDTPPEDGQGRRTGKRRDREEDRPKGWEWAFVDFLEEAVRLMRERQASLRGRLRKHRPAEGDPLIVLLIDELASLTAYVTDREAKRRIAAAHALLLSQGRAVSIVVVSALQDARKEVLPDRNLYPTRLALRLSEPEEVDLVLGKDARKKGARCDEIADDQPGVGFVVLEDQPEPARVRFGYVSDEEIARLAETYRPGQVPAGDQAPELAELPEPYPDDPHDTPSTATTSEEDAA